MAAGNPRLWRGPRQCFVVFKSATPGAQPASASVICFDADGLDWPMLVRGDKIHLLPKARFAERNGTVTEKRRYLIAREIVEVLRLPIHRR